MAHSGSEQEKQHKIERTAVLRDAINRATNEYIQAQEGSSPAVAVSMPVAGAAGPTLGSAGWRRSFNANVLKGIDHIEAGHASAAELRVVQQALVDQGLDLGKTGAKTHNGVDGDARTMTITAIAKVKTRPAGSGPAAGG